MIASLPMYDRPETAAATDRLWVGIRDGLRARGINAPDGLTRAGNPLDQWQSPDLVFSQTCGLPYAVLLKDRVTLVGLPDHHIEGCAPGQYLSVIIARAGPVPDPPRLAVNDALSQSGWANFQSWLHQSGTTIGPVVLTGAHRASAQAVAEGRADLAAIDAQSWWLMRQHDRFTDKLTVIDRTASLAGLPFIAPQGADVTAYRVALSEAVQSLSPADKATLNLHDIVRASKADFADRVQPPAPGH